jgi:hypothetical protein
MFGVLMVQEDEGDADRRAGEASRLGQDA